jgi:hypothetical protein
MEIQRIISGAQTGADRAALDFALEYGIEHGGWVPAGRLAEDGVIPERYNVWEMTAGGYPERTEKNVAAADGTLIFSHGELTGGSLMTLELAEKYERPCLHVDFRRVLAFDAAIDINDWIVEHGVAVVNVAGPRSSKDPDIYPAVFKALETVFYIGIISDAMPDTRGRSAIGAETGEAGAAYPDRVGGALDMLVSELPAKIKAQVASMPEDQFSEAGLSLGRWIVRHFGLAGGNPALFEECRSLSGRPDLDAGEAGLLIVRELWRRLRRMGHLRIVK